MRILLIGHARHGKDTVAALLSQHYGLAFESSSGFVGREFVYPWMKEAGYGYKSFEECFEDRVNHRRTWFKLIRHYAGESGTKVAESILEKNDLYVGMRNRFEFEACKKAGLFDTVVFIDAARRLPPESEESMELGKEDADYILDNNGSEEDLLVQVHKFMKQLTEEVEKLETDAKNPNN